VCLTWANSDDLQNASFIINSMIVYQKQQLAAAATRSAAEDMVIHRPLTAALMAFGLAVPLLMYL
jgi:hypothetical protein